ncbi:MAG: hypothetical protein WCX13_03010 [Candidatus Hydrogenedentales bacterium]
MNIGIAAFAFAMSLWLWIFSKAIKKGTTPGAMDQDGFRFPGRG